MIKIQEKKKKKHEEIDIHRIQILSKQKSHWMMYRVYGIFFRIICI